MKRFFPLLISLLLLTNLLFGQTTGIKAVPQSVTPDTYVGRQICVGSGGGVTGFTTTYYLLDNGKLFRRRSRDSTFTLLGQHSPVRTACMFRTVEKTCKITTTTFDHPGNLYKFVQWRHGEQHYKVIWGEANKKVPQVYARFYSSFMKKVPGIAKPK